MKVKFLAVSILMEYCKKQLHEVRVWSDVADRMRGLPPEFRDPEIQLQAVEALTDVIHTIDITLELPEIDDWLISNFIHPMLLLQFKALISRHHLLGSWDDYDRALQIYEIASQLSVHNSPSLDIVRNYNALRAFKFSKNTLENPIYIDKLKAQRGWISCVPSFRTSNNTARNLIKETYLSLMVWLHAAAELVEVPPYSRDTEHQTRVIAGLDSMIPIEKFAQSLETDDLFVPSVYYALNLQTRALFHRFQLLGSQGDLHHAIHTLEWTSQFCSSQEEHQSVSQLLGTMASWNISSALLSKLHLSFNFLVTAHRTIHGYGAPMPKMGESIGRFTQLDDEFDEVLAVLEGVTKGETLDVEEDELESLCMLLFLRGRAYFLRYQAENSFADMQCAISDLEIAYHLTDTTSVQFSLVSVALLVCLLSCYYCNEDQLALDRLVDVGTDANYSPSSKKYHDGRVILIHGLTRRAMQYEDKGYSRGINWSRNVADCEQILELFEEDHVSAYENPEQYGLELGAAAAAWFLLTELGQKLDVDQVSRYIEGSEIQGMLTSTQCPLHCSFLWGQLRNSAIAGDIKTVSKIYRRIQNFGFAEYSETVSPTSLYDKDLDHTITLLKRHCPAPMSTFNDPTVVPIMLVLAGHLMRRYLNTSREQDYQEAAFYRLWAMKDNFPVGSEGQFVHPIYGLDYGIDRVDSGCGAVARARYIDVLRKAKNSDHPLVRGRKRFTRNPEHVHTSTVINPFDVHCDIELLKIEHSVSLDQAMIPVSLLPSSMGRDSQISEKLAQVRDGIVSTYTSCSVVSDHDMKEGVHLAEQTLKEIHEFAQSCGLDAGNHHDIQNAMEILQHQELRGVVSHDQTLSDPSIRACAFDDLRQSASNWDTDVIGSLHLWLNLYYREPNPEVVKHCQPYAERTMNRFISCIEKRSWVASGAWESVFDRHVFNFGGITLIGCCLRMGDVKLLVDYTERWRCQIWNQLGQLRAPLDTLRSVKPDLAARLQHVSHSLEKRWTTFDPTSWDPSVVNPLEISNFPLFDERERIIEEIRLIPGFEDFFQHRSPFRDHEFLEVVRSGVVIFMVTFYGRTYCCVFVPCPSLEGESTHELGNAPIFSFMALETEYVLPELRAQFKKLVNMRSDVSDAVVPETHGLQEDSPSRFDFKPHKNRSMEHLLEKLWYKIVEPIIDRVQSANATQERNSGARRIPDRDKRTRIWWCCGGELSFLPLHAAGIYHGESQINVSDFFVSSYAPSLRALVDAHKRPIPTWGGLKVLAAAQPNAKSRGGLSGLTNTKKELQVIKDTVPPQNLIYLNDDGVLDLEGKYTSVESVFAKLPDVAVLHLACHGTQDQTNPMNSGFFLGNGKRLTIHKLIQNRYPNAFMAILSACHTASNDAEQPDEAINIASALMFLGFRTILGTKWPMKDIDGPDVAKAVYHALFNQQITPEVLTQTSPSAMEQQLGDHLGQSKTFDPESDLDCAEMSQSPTEEHITARTEGSGDTLATFSLAHVVDDLVRKMRENHVPAKRWATFVHIGV